MGELRVEHVSTFLHSEIQGEKIPEIPEGMPFTPEFLDRLLSDCPVVVEIIHGEEEGGDKPLYGAADTSTFGLHRISNNHGRSYELSLGIEDGTSKPLAIWADEHDNVYSSLSLKGNNFSRLFIQKSLTAPSSYIPHGLQETDSFLRVMRASRMMTEANIGTEKIIRVVEPQRFRVPAFDPDTDTAIDDTYEYVPLHEAKRRLLIMDWQKIAAQPNAVEEFTRVKQAIDNMSFFITLRAMSVGNRVLDLCRPAENFLPQLAHIFRVLETVTEHEEGNGPLSVDNKEHLEWFFEFYLPTTIGMNMAKLHKLGLVHTFPTTGNINALGDLIDLDSVKGAPLGLGDDEMTDDNFFGDVLYFIHDPDNQDEFEHLARNFVRAMGDAYVPEEEYMLEHEKNDEYIKNKVFVGNFKARFISAYVQERFNINEDYQMTAEDLRNFLDFIDKDIKEGEGYGYDPYLRATLERYMVSTEYQTLIEDEEMLSIAQTFTRWAVEQSADRLMRIVMSRMEIQNAQQFTNDAELELAIYYECLDLIHLEERVYRHNLATEYMESDEFIAKLKPWLAEQIKPEAALDHELIARATVTALREYISRSIHKLSLDIDKHPGRNVHFLIEQVARGLYERNDYDAEVHGMLVDNAICSVWNGVPEDILLDSLKVRDEIELIRHKESSLTSNISIESRNDFRLQQIYHDGSLVQEFDIKLHGEPNMLGGGATLSFIPSPDSSYIAWTMLENEKRLHLFVARRQVSPVTDNDY